ncbi:MAG: hypothetical protein AB1894_07590 [Chloroflexota bacterium]
MTFTIRTLVEADTNALDHLLQTYTRQYPPRICMPAQFYLSPYFDGGQKIACAFDGNGRLVGYAPYFAQGEHAWVEVMALPGLDRHGEVRSALWAWLVEQAMQGSQQQLLFQYYSNEDLAIRFVEQQGAQRRYSIFAMRRDLSLAIPTLSMPAGFSLRRWRLESEAEQRQYLEGRNACFPEAPTSLEEWLYFASSPYWEQGINMAAFAGEHLAASVLVYWQSGSPTGSTEYVFTLPGSAATGCRGCCWPRRWVT